MEIINVKTKRGLILKSIMYGCENADTVMILMSGICSNIFNNQLLQTTGEVLSENGIAYICGQTMNAFSLLHYSNTQTGKQELKGVALDDLSLSYEDIDAYIEFAKSKGFKNIVLGGHSLGSNKIINYLSINHDPVIKHFVISGPVDYADFINAGGRKSYYLNVAENFVKEGRGDDILPFLFVDFSPMSANTLLQWYSNKSFKNCPILSGDGETESLNKISVNGVFIIGEKDSCTGGNAFEFASKINSYTKNPQDNEIVIIPDAGHVFYNKHNEYAETVLNYIKSKELATV